MRRAVPFLAAALAVTLVACASGDDVLEGTDCVELSAGLTSPGRFVGPSDARDVLIRTDAEYDAAFPTPCLSPRCNRPPRPAAGELLLMAVRHWSGCGVCAEISCVTRASDGSLVATVRENGGWGDCDSEGGIAVWALVMDPGGPVSFRAGEPLAEGGCP